MEYWSIGVLEYWSVGAFEHWSSREPSALSSGRHFRFDSKGNDPRNRPVCGPTRSITSLLHYSNAPSLQYSVFPFSRAFSLCLPALNRQSSALARKGLMRHGSVLSLPVLQPVMKTRKVPRECSPSLLSGKRRWRLFHWISRRTERGGAKIID
jgi:hypothetical protein